MSNLLLWMAITNEFCTTSFSQIPLNFQEVTSGGCLCACPPTPDPLLWGPHELRDCDCPLFSAVLPTQAAPQGFCNPAKGSLQPSTASAPIAGLHPHTTASPADFH